MNKNLVFSIFALLLVLSSCQKTELEQSTMIENDKVVQLIGDAPQVASGDYDQSFTPAGSHNQTFTAYSGGGNNLSLLDIDCDTSDDPFYIKMGVDDSGFHLDLEYKLNPDYTGMWQIPSWANYTWELRLDDGNATKMYTEQISCAQSNCPTDVQADFDWTPDFEEDFGAYYSLTDPSVSAIIELKVDWGLNSHTLAKWKIQNGEEEDTELIIGECLDLFYLEGLGSGASLSWFGAYIVP